MNEKRAMQRLFNLALFGVRGQGRPALNNLGGCVYRVSADDGSECRCAAGWTIRDPQLLLDVTLAASGVTGMGPRLFGRMHREHANIRTTRYRALITAIQTAHDAAALGVDTLSRFCPRFEARMSDVARRFDLKYTEATS